MTREFDVIVIGGGIMGVCTLYALQQRGVKAALIEQFTIGHDKGSSHGDTRVIRKSIFEDLRYVPLINASYDLWEHLQKEAGKQLIFSCTLQYILPQGDPFIPKLEQLHAQFPDLIYQDQESEIVHKENETVFTDKTAGYALAEASLLTIADLARKKGGVIVENERVTSWDDGLITTSRQTFSAKKIILTKGAWSVDVLPVHLRVVRKTLNWFKDEGQHANISFLTQGKNEYYSFPSKDGTLKIADHAGGDDVTSPEQPFTVKPPEDIPPVLTQRYNIPNPVLVKQKSCMYSLTEDENFIIDFLDESKNVIVAAGFSGHGFKFAPVVGQILADLAVDGHTRYDLGFFSLARFRK